MYKRQILTNTQLDILQNIRYKGFNTVKLHMLFETAKGEEGLHEALDEDVYKRQQ